MWYNTGLKSDSIKPLVLVSMDGWGIAPPSQGNAVYLARPKAFDSFWSQYPHGQLIASGEAVGLPANEVGNSEVGHLTMGVGRVIYQSLERINTAIRDEVFDKNQALVQVITRVKAQGGNLHLIGLVSSGNVHASMPHLMALLKLCKRTQFGRVLIHVITDGRDAPPQEGLSVVGELDAFLKQELPEARIASVGGRYFAMDRDGRWERIKQAYEVMVAGQGPAAPDLKSIFKATYAMGKSDEFIPPTVMVPEGKAPHRITERDEVIFFNFRVDRARELTMALTMPDFERANTQALGFDPHQSGFGMSQSNGVSTFVRGYWPKGLRVTTMTEYQAGLPVAGVAFGPQKTISNSVSEVVSKFKWPQLKLAESEKERMVTYYFDGMQDPFSLETVEIVPSPKVDTYDQKPEMAAQAIVKKLKQELKQNLYRFVMINLANPDMVAHTGNLLATVKAVKATDKAIDQIVAATLKVDGTVVVTADHGNSEELITYPTGTFFFTTSQGTVNTDHSNNPIPLIVINRAYEGKAIELPRGVMSDVAPTILTLMGLPVPPEMTGRNLLG